MTARTSRLLLATLRKTTAAAVTRNAGERRPAMQRRASTRFMHPCKPHSCKLQVAKFIV